MKKTRKQMIYDAFKIAEKYVMATTMMTIKYPDGYDWNSDPMHLTLMQGEFLKLSNALKSDGSK